MTISNSHVLNCRVNAPGLWPLTISLGADCSILLQLGGRLYSKADSDSGDTLVRNPSERDAAEQKPTPIKPGVWRNKVWTFIGFDPDFLDDEDTLLDQQTVLSGRFKTESAAREGYRALERANAGDPELNWDNSVIYLGPVFFPEEGGVS